MKYNDIRKELISTINYVRRCSVITIGDTKLYVAEGLRYNPFVSLLAYKASVPLVALWTRSTTNKVVVCASLALDGNAESKAFDKFASRTGSTIVETPELPEPTRTLRNSVTALELLSEGMLLVPDKIIKKGEEPKGKDVYTFAENGGPLKQSANLLGDEYFNYLLKQERGSEDEL